ncbi:hypothetical protein LRS13_07965 [Svornostia abyssi]|uniref:Acetyl-coenzyme A synthetase N-terminal domain-containing protein n=1 Tax=Svornostia abyssi TaxID=2898438 RepID=A0ABY5PLM0_9ACTN|nr:hypothetical protein LRS13_07965 [Parviterribacteraceae bacterium J379]
MPGAGTEEQLAQRLEELLSVERFAPPAAFTDHALIPDGSAHAAAAAEPAAWWAEQAKALSWFREPTIVLDDQDPPFYRWFVDGTINASHVCVDRHVEAGHGDRVAFHWYGEEGESRDITYADLHRDVQRMANALKARGDRPR